jgi:hypothetical protein
MTTPLKPDGNPRLEPKPEIEPYPLESPPAPQPSPVQEPAKPHVIPVLRVPEPYPLADDPRFKRPGERTPRPQHRQYLAMLLIGTTTALALGHTLRTPAQLEANDISRWCTVWSLLERHSYAIDDCPWQAKTQDKVKKPDKIAAPIPKAGPVKQLEYAIAPEAWKSGEPTERFYSSKPPLLPTLIAGLLYPVRRLTGVPLGDVVDQTRLPRNVQKDVPGEPGKTRFVTETPEPARWPVYVFYFKPVTVLLNVVPMLLMLVLYARLLDRVAPDDWSWFLSLFAASIGTYLFVFNQTLNNHTVAAASAFFTIYALQKIWAGESRSARAFAAAGFFGAFTACNELPAAVFGLLLFLFLFARFPGRTLKFFAPAAAVPIVAFLATQYIAFGQFKPVYEEFGTKSYNYEGSYWNTPLEMDWFNLEKNQEPYEVYLFHMTFGHHGVFLLSPIFLFGLYGALREIVVRGRMAPVGWLTVLLTVAMLAFYTWNPKARNYGGSTQGLRWLFWVIPFWLALLPCGVRGGDSNRWVRGITLAALLVSAFSVGYALRNPWSHPWALDMLEHLGVYNLVR